jgi:hypothetical protein
MAVCEAEGINFVFGVATNANLRSLVEATADDARTRHAEEGVPALRRYAGTSHSASSWFADRRVIVRIEATPWASTSASS